MLAFNILLLSHTYRIGSRFWGRGRFLPPRQDLSPLLRPIARRASVFAFPPSWHDHEASIVHSKSTRVISTVSPRAFVLHPSLPQLAPRVVQDLLQPLWSSIRDQRERRGRVLPATLISVPAARKTP